MKRLNQCTPANPRVWCCKNQRPMRTNRCSVLRSGSHRIPGLLSLQFSSSVALEGSHLKPSCSRPAKHSLAQQGHSCHFHSSSSLFLPAIPSSHIFPELKLSPTLAACIHHSTLPEHLSLCQSIFPRRDELCQEIGSTKPSRPPAREKGSCQAAFGSRSMRICGWEALGGA